MISPNDRGRILESMHVTSKNGAQHITPVLEYTNTDTGAAAGTYQIKAFMDVVRCKTTGASTDFVLQMPPAGSCPGKRITVWMTAHDTSDVTLSDYEDDTAKGTLGGADVTLNGADDWIVLESNGMFWFTVDSNGI